MSQKRQLAAVLFTDMVGYTALMSRDEALAQKLRRRHGIVLRSCHEKHDGEIIQYFGDGTLSIFPSTMAATQCAIDIQRELRSDPVVPLRIGLHSGEVVRDDEGLFGSAVNIASRLESFAVEGAILTSVKVRDELSNQPNFVFESMGTYQLKNVPKPMEIFAIANEGIVVPTEDELEGKGQKLSDIILDAPSVSKDGIAVNDLLIDTICEELAVYSAGLDNELNKEILDIPSIKREIIDAFPTPIGEQLRILFTRSSIPGRPDEIELFTAARLNQLIVTHRTTLRFISFIMLSQLWDVKRNDDSFVLSETQLNSIKSFLAQDVEQFESTDFVFIIRTIRELFQEKGIPFFLEELAHLQTGMDKTLEESHQNLLKIHEEIKEGKIKPKEVEDKCLVAEESLGYILQKVAFLVKYKLVTIKNIELIKSRHQDARFRHSQITLNKALTVASTGVAEIGIEFENYTDNKSVLILKADQNVIKEYLNLTPFLIDENALNSELSSKIYLFTYHADDSYYYQFLNNPVDRPLGVNQKRYPMIKNHFDRFKSDVFGITVDADQAAKKRGGTSRFMRKR